MIKADSSLKAYELIKKSISIETEEVWVLALNSNLELIERDLIFKGTADKCLIHPRDIFRFLCRNNAISFILAHSHPSGDSHPSKEDIKITKQLYIAGRLFEINMADHLIIAKNQYFSFADYGFMQKFQSIRSVKLS